MAINSTVRWFHSDMPGAPEIRDQPGGLIGVLDACLLNGFDTRVINTLVVSGGVATATISSGHAYEKHAVVRISGATPANLNGDWRIKEVQSPSVLKFDCPDLPDGSATGTITCVRATPGFWEKAFAATNKGAYRSTHLEASGLFLRVDDTATGTLVSKVRGYTTMSDVDTGAGPFPDFSQAPSFSWRRTATTSAAVLPRTWTLIADKAFFWFLVGATGGKPSTTATIYFFGDLAGASAYDNYPCAVAAHNTTNTAPLPYTGLASFNLAGSSAGMFLARDASGTAATPVGLRMYGHKAGEYVGGGQAWPAEINGGYLFHLPCSAYSESKYRGDMPGLIQSLTHKTQTIGSDIRRVLDPDSAMNFAILLHACTGPSSGDPNAHIAFDIFGPWR